MRHCFRAFRRTGRLLPHASDIFRILGNIAHDFLDRSILIVSPCRDFRNGFSDRISGIGRLIRIGAQLPGGLRQQFRFLPDIQDQRLQMILHPVHGGPDLTDLVP